ncbi:hypothetical protein DPMN_045718 [Dreissena polymorpha]|uniref:Uncharacterized protein n=1 Tax=Dreissena polymorpha TaxID=45954 RepID=A0A9D4D718_DREPO|nr:hypothetical protein DPMN_045718 [Dreissena polymorpha]
MRVGDRCLKIFDEVKWFLLEYRVDAIFRSCKDMNFTVDGVKSVLTQLLKTEMYLFYEANLVGASVTDDGMVLSFSVLFEQTELIELEKAFSRFQDNMNRFNINEGHFSLRAGRSPYATIVAGKSLYIEYSSQRFGGDCIRPECVVIRRRRFAMAEIQFCKGFLFNEFKADAGKNAAIIFNMTFQTYEFAYKVDEANVTRIFMCQNTFFNKLNEWNVFESRNAGMTIRCIRLSVVLAVADLLIMVFNM